MGASSKRSRRYWWIIAAIVAAGWVVIGPRGPGWDVAIALDKEVAGLQRLAESTGGVRRAKAIDDLVKLDSADSRKALATLAGSSNEELAALAMFALGRSGTTGDRQALEGVIEDTKRSDNARAVALTAWCALKERDGAKWDDLKTYVDGKCAKNDALTDTAAVIKAARFTKAGSK